MVQPINVRCNDTVGDRANALSAIIDKPPSIDRCRKSEQRQQTRRSLQFTPPQPMMLVATSRRVAPRLPCAILTKPIPATQPINATTLHTVVRPWLLANSNNNNESAAAIQRRNFTTPVTPSHFDTHRVVKKLQEQGFSPLQAEAILDVMKDAMMESLDAQARILATKSEHVELRAELSERVFNSTLKFDIAQRHMRELLERDFNNLKQDIRMLEKIDFDKIRMEIADLEKKFLLQKQAEDETLNDLRLSMEKVEKRMLQYAVGFAGTIMAVGAALMRLVM